MPQRESFFARSRALLIILAVIAGVAIGGWWLAHHTTAPAQFGFGRGGFSRGGGLVMPVGAEAAKQGDINVVLEEIGTVTPLRSVTVNAQVAGQLLTVNFKEGQMVKQGDLLAEIDPRPYQAALTQAQGALARDQALLAEAKIDLDRYQTLFKQDSIAKQQLDSQASLVHQYEGTVQTDQGQIQTATVNLGYTKITAPVTGRVGLRQVDPGNNVQSGGASSIVVITQLKPIDVLFAIAEDDLPQVLAKMHAGAVLSVDAYDRLGKVKLAGGTLLSLDNLVDTSTGTVKAKAEFANDDEGLFPNQFVNIRLRVDTLHGAITIPTSALERGSGGLFVYVVQPDKTVAVRNIKTGPTEGERVAVTDGLRAGEIVVTSGADRLREGSKVELPGDNPQPPADAAKTAGGHARQGQGQGRHQRRAGASVPAASPAQPNSAQPNTSPPTTPPASGNPA